MPVLLDLPPRKLVFGRALFLVISSGRIESGHVILLESASRVKDGTDCRRNRRERGPDAKRQFYAPVNGRLIGGGASAPPLCFFLAAYSLRIFSIMAR